MKKKADKKPIVPPIPLYPVGSWFSGSMMDPLGNCTGIPDAPMDPLGSYPGVPADPMEKPVQDADDL